MTTVEISIEKNCRYRNPDAIMGGTWEALERVLERAGHFKGGLRKIECARTMAPYLDVRRNRSKSFHVLRDMLASLADLASP